MTGDYLALAGRIQQEIVELDRIVLRTVSAWREATREVDDYHIDAVALNLHGFYVGFERVFEMICDVVDRSRPAGQNWHQELLRQMSAPIPRVRPAVSHAETVRHLDRFRGFRHVVRNVYTFNLDPEQIAALVSHLPETFEAARMDLLAFCHLLIQLGSEDSHAASGHHDT